MTGTQTHNRLLTRKFKIKNNRVLIGLGRWYRMYGMYLSVQVLLRIVPAVIIFCYFSKYLQSPPLLLSIYFLFCIRSVHPSVKKVLSSSLLSTFFLYFDAIPQRQYYLVPGTQWWQALTIMLLAAWAPMTDDSIAQTTKHKLKLKQNTKYKIP